MSFKREVFDTYAASFYISTLHTYSEKNTGHLLTSFVRRTARKGAASCHENATCCVSCVHSIVSVCLCLPLPVVACLFFSYYSVLLFFSWFLLVRPMLYILTSVLRTSESDIDINRSCATAPWSGCTFLFLFFVFLFSSSRLIINQTNHAPSVSNHLQLESCSSAAC